MQADVGRADSGGGRGIALIAVTYIYFLIFAQFAFLARLSELGAGGDAVRLVMGTMALGGIICSLAAPRLTTLFSHQIALRIGFAVCLLAALLTLLQLNTGARFAVAFLVGAGLGIVTVTLVSHLHAWTGERAAALKVGAGTGLAYLVCNVPAVFAARPEQQALLAAGASIFGMLLTLRPPQWFEEPFVDPAPREPFGYVLVSLAALVWLDSAAFFIILHVPALKAGTWLGSVHLWTNGCVHLIAALAAGAALARRNLRALLAAAYLALGFACILLLRGQVLPASLLYPIGVSLYSVVLVAYPSLLTSATSSHERARQAAWLYIVAGWVASALGIGMGQNLGYVPLAFVIAAGTVVLLRPAIALLRTRPNEVALLACTLASALVVSRLLPQHKNEADAVERGREVYISEGCIHCHSQYVRPGSPDVLLWGPVKALAAVRQERPPLIGNRRQGPDLTQVGLRRSPLWLKAHLYQPSEVAAGSIMPAYAHLFRDGRGDDLVAYLSSLHSGHVAVRVSAEQAWRPSAVALRQANAVEGERVYVRFCATCHDRNGAARTRWASEFRDSPQDLTYDPLQYATNPDPDTRLIVLARIAKFGLPGTDMPGHEYLSDQQIASVSAWINQTRTARRQ